MLRVVAEPACEVVAGAGGHDREAAAGVGRDAGDLGDQPSPPHATRSCPIGGGLACELVGRIAGSMRHRDLGAGRGARVLRSREQLAGAPAPGRRIDDRRPGHARGGYGRRASATGRRELRSAAVADLDLAQIPKHVAIVMDGNGRWAQRRGLKRTDGHAAGEEALFDTVEGALEIGLEWMTVYAFSTENWRRPLDEVRFLMNFNERLLVARRDELHEQGRAGPVHRPARRAGPAPGAARASRRPRR